MLQIPHGDWSLQMLQLPASEPMTLDQGKNHLRIPLDVTDFDANVGDYIKGARDYIEETYGLPIMPQKVRVNLQQFPREDRIKLPIWPVYSVDAARYYTVDGQSHTLTTGVAADFAGPTPPDLLVRLSKKPCEIVLPWAHIWPPVVLQMADAIQFDLTVGFGNGSPTLQPLPPAVMQALRLLLGHEYDIGAAVTVIGRPSEPLVLGVEAMMANIRLHY